MRIIKGRTYLKIKGKEYTEPSVGLCNVCNQEVVLGSFTNTCNCGTEYNICGQQLASREDWGEETGETGDDFSLGLSKPGKIGD
jgi:hypothetical protein